MADIYLKKYSSDQSLDGYNAPHKYRFAIKSGMDSPMILQIWNSQKNEVLNNLIKALDEFQNEKFYFGLAPSRTTFFVDDIKAKILESFNNAIDISQCLKREDGFDAGSTQSKLSSEDLLKIFSVSEKCIEKLKISPKSKILLLDDVYARGNTFEGLKLALKKSGISNQVKTAVILEI